ncbi:MAG: sulfurtransferase, partial [Alphaproteobacteria bacterium]|nr:sulfurtransferase [Alphaproteobacteria bacterium]
MDYANPDGLVSTEWLERHLGEPGVRVVDASYWMKSMQRNAREEFLDCRIPGAVYFDIDEISDHDSDIPHMLPKPEAFAEAVGRLGLGDGHRVVVYDGVGGGSAAARVWWMFRMYGHKDVAVLAGGFPKWLREQRVVDDLPPSAPVPAVFTPRFVPSFLRELDDVAAAMKTHGEQIVDGRKPERFHGVAPDADPNVRQGHIPGSLNLPVAELVDPRELTLLPADAMRERFEKAGVDLGKPVVNTCGEGITCCLLTLGLYLLGKTDVANYDGSWSEWA